MATVSNAQLANRIESLIHVWNRREAQYAAWVGGSADGGSNADGMYELTDSLGQVVRVPSPARVTDMVSGPAQKAVEASKTAGGLVELLGRDINRMDALRVTLDATLQAAQRYKESSEEYALRAANHEANVRHYHDNVAEDAAHTSYWRDDAQYYAGWAENWAFDARSQAQQAQASAEQAGNYDPSKYAKVSGGNTYVGVQKFKNTGEPGMQILQEDEQFGMRFGPKGGISFKENGVWLTPHGNLKDLAFRSELSAYATNADLSALAALPLMRTDTPNVATRLQSVRLSGSESGIHITSNASTSNADNAEFIIESFQPRILFSDRSTDAKNMLFHYNGNATGGNFYIKMDTAGDGAYSDVALHLNTVNKTLNVGGVAVLTANNGVSQAATNLGKTVNGPLISGVRDAAWWSGLPTGYSAMVNLTKANGVPVEGFGYFLKMARRDAGGGWSGLWQGYHAKELYFGRAENDTTMPVWFRVWNDQNFNPDHKMSSVVNDWGRSTDGVARTYYAASGRSFFGAADGFEWRSKTDAKIFAISNTGIVNFMQDQWHQTVDGKPRMYLRSSDGRTLFRGGGVEFRNEANVTIGHVTAGGAYQAGTEIYTGASGWFRVSGTEHGIYWEKHGGGWHMYDSTWMRVYGGKSIHTSGAYYGIDYIRTDAHYRVGDVIQPVFRSGTTIPSNNLGVDGDLYVQF